MTTAAWLAATLGVSVRTVYRDLGDLTRSGVPIEGEAGVGYAIRHGMSLPPLQLAKKELLAISIGLRFVQSFTSRGLAAAASTAFAKIRTVSPPEVLEAAEREKIIVPPTRAAAGECLEDFSAAISQQEKVAFKYMAEDGGRSSRVVRPLALFYAASGWNVTAWCELRSDFRTFRLNRIQDLARTDERFTDESGRTLEDYFETLERKYELRREQLNPELA